MIIFISLVGSLYATGDFQSREVAKQPPFLQAEAASPTSLFGFFGGANDDTGTMNGLVKCCKLRRSSKSCIQKKSLICEHN